MNKVRNAASGLHPLAMSFVLPHENRAMRLPMVPATLTALLETMSDTTVPVPDTSSRRAFLCRDACYPLWMERTVANGAVWLEATGSAGSWTLPTAANKLIQLPNWDRLTAATASATIDGAVITAAGLVDYGVLGDAPGTSAIYIPPGSTFQVLVDIGGTGSNSLEMEVAYQVGGEEFTSTFLIGPTTLGYITYGTAGTPISGGEGNWPSGFTWIRSFRTGSLAVTGASAPVLKFGWSTGGAFNIPSGTATLMLPVFQPPEFNNSTLPYSRSRLNASAALFTNVTAALSKEGTILAARLKPSIVDPWSFTTANVNSVHPKLRYFGPLEKGLYTFTTPNGNVTGFDDMRITLPSNSSYNAAERPLFSYKDIGLYNAIIFQDLGSASVGTQLAVSCYTHIEYETTSSLFQVGVSKHTLESLHAAEVALLDLGHFHENPIHWATIAKAASVALSKVAPMVAPIVAHYGQHLLDRGVAYLSGRNAAGDRKMSQASLQPARVQTQQGKTRKAKAQKKVNVAKRKK